MPNSSQICKTCSIEKSITDFHFRKDNNCYRKTCKICWAIKGKKYTAQNKEKVALYQKKFALENSEHLKQYRANYYSENKEYLNEKNKIDYHNNIEKYRALSKAYYEKHKELKPVLTPEEKASRAHLNIIKHRLRQRVHNVLKLRNWEKCKSLYEYIGCSKEQLIQHIESQFESGMSWENRSEWHIDHVMPLASANTSEELYMLCFYLNLKPMWASDNISKNDKITPEGLKILHTINEVRGVI